MHYKYIVCKLIFSLYFIVKEQKSFQVLKQNQLDIRHGKITSKYQQENCQFLKYLKAEATFIKALAFILLVIC